MTPRDREIVRWIGRHRMVTATQLAERFFIGRSQCYGRLTGLVRSGLLRHERLLHGEPGVYLATRAGLDLAGIGLPAATVDLRTYEHDVSLVTLVSALERASPAGTMVCTERELRAHDTPARTIGRSYRPRYAVQLGAGNQLALTPSGSPRLHFPDAAVVGSRGDIAAIELERTLKGRARLRGILRAYVAARHLSRVRYFVPNDRVHAVLMEEICQLRAEHLVEVSPWTKDPATV